MQDQIQVERGSRLDYDDLSAQENGEFTFLVGKKEQGGKGGGVRVIRAMGFYTAGITPKEMRINDFIPVEPPEPGDLPRNREAVNTLLQSFASGSFASQVERCMRTDYTLLQLHQVLEKNYPDDERGISGRAEASLAALGWYLGGRTAPTPQPREFVAPTGRQLAPAATVTAAAASKAAAAPAAAVGPAAVLAALARQINASPVQASPYPAPAPALVEVPPAGTNLIMATDADTQQFVAPLNGLLDMEMLARGVPFASMEDKFQAEERAGALRRAIGTQTRYPGAATAPARTPLPVLKQTLAQLSRHMPPAGSHGDGSDRATTGR